MVINFINTFFIGGIYLNFIYYGSAIFGWSIICIAGFFPSAPLELFSFKNKDGVALSRGLGFSCQFLEAFFEPATYTLTVILLWIMISLLWALYWNGQINREQIYGYQQKQVHLFELLSGYSSRLIYFIVWLITLNIGSLSSAT